MIVVKYLDNNVTVNKRLHASGAQKRSQSKKKMNAALEHVVPLCLYGFGCGIELQVNQLPLQEKPRSILTIQKNEKIMKAQQLTSNLMWASLAIQKWQKDMANMMTIKIILFTIP